MEIPEYTSSPRRSPSPPHDPDLNPPSKSLLIHRYLRSRLGNTGVHTDPGSKEKVINIRFLVSNAAVDCINGKGGSPITEFQSQSGACIQLLQNYGSFRGTSDRIITISGAFDEVLKAMELILEKLHSETEESSDVDSRSNVRLIVPNSSCGGLTGEGGSTLKSFIEDSRADIKISSPQEHKYAGVNDRLVILIGTRDEQMRAIFLIMSKLIEDSHHPQSVTIGVADEYIGTVVGRGGRNIMEITQVSGARIKISDRGDFMPGTSKRKVTISGLAEAIRSAEKMIKQKVESRVLRSSLWG